MGACPTRIAAKRPSSARDATAKPRNGATLRMPRLGCRPNACLTGPCRREHALASAQPRVSHNTYDTPQPRLARSMLWHNRLGSIAKQTRLGGQWSDATAERALSLNFKTSRSAATAISPRILLFLHPVLAKLGSQFHGKAAKTFRSVNSGKNVTPGRHQNGLTPQQL